MLGFKAKKEEFFAHFEESTKLIHEGAQVLNELMKDYSSLPQKMEELEVLEEKGDEITRTILDKVNKTFATPIDREDIFSLAQNLDDILDGMNSTCEKMVLYKAGQPNECVKEMIKLLGEVSVIIQEAFTHLSKLSSKQEYIISLCRQINALESKGDLLYKEGVAQLFDQVNDPIELIKWKEIYKDLEDVLDLCEDLGDLVKGVVLKYA